MLNETVAFDTFFSPDYSTARKRFRAAAAELNWSAEQHPINARGPDGGELALDVAISREGDAGRVLVISSGMHGIEGFFGSALQTALLKKWADEGPPPVKCLFLHALNPYGMAWLRRFNENNIDLNRNFLLPGEKFEGAPETYSKLNHFLNPPSAPSKLEPFLLKAALLIVRHGMPSLKQAVAAGQYEYPQGLFYGGSAPSEIQSLLLANLPRLLAGAETVIHLDIHTGLGKNGGYKLLIDYTPDEKQIRLFSNCFGDGSFERFAPTGISYDARGSFGRWCVSQRLAPVYMYAAAEFGTYGPVRVLRALRDENRAHHWGAPGSSRSREGNSRLMELFCPSSPEWRSNAIAKGLDLAVRAGKALDLRQNQ